MSLHSLLTGLRGQVAMQTEIIALRHQLAVLQRTHKPRRILLNRTDRCLWVWLSRLWSGWRSALLIVKPETVIGWHHQGFRWYWTWKIRHGRPGRPCVPKETRDLIRTMSRDIGTAAFQRDDVINNLVPVIQRDVAGRQLRIDDPHVVVFENDFVLGFLLDSDDIRADGHLHVNVGPTTLKAAAAFTR